MIAKKVFSRLNTDEPPSAAITAIPPERPPLYNVDLFWRTVHTLTLV